jgi:hypothetical protein
MTRFETIGRLLRRTEAGLERAGGQRVKPRRSALRDGDPERASSAQRAYRAMLSDQIEPALRELGLEGSGQEYQLPSDTYWALIGFQKSCKRSTRKKIVFTVNLLAASRKLWAEKHAEDPDWYPEPPDANVLRVEFWNARLGMLLPKGEDRWWEVNPDRLTSPIAQDVVAAIREYGLPAMREQMQ